jgi:hypothetical protein
MIFVGISISGTYYPSGDNTVLLLSISGTSCLLVYNTLLLLLNEVSTNEYYNYGSIMLSTTYGLECRHIVEFGSHKV